MDASGSPSYVPDLTLDPADAPGGVLVYYADGNEEIIHVNTYVVRLFDCASVEEFLQLTQGSFRGMPCEEDFEVTQDSIAQQVIKQDGAVHTYFRIRTKTDRLVTVHIFGKLNNPDEGRPTFSVFLAEVKQGGSVDWLTGLPNMERFHSLARMGAKALSQRGERPAALSFDIMGMKSYNLLFGREGGDRLLRTFANALRHQFGTEGCSRLSGDQFVSFCSADEVEGKVDALFDDFKARFGKGAPPVRSGAYVCEPDDDIVDEGLERAKAACDLDRKSWYSHLTWYTDEMRAQDRLRTHVLNHLGEALTHNWVQPFYQAVVRAATGEVCGEEALARWMDPAYGTLPPNLFIPVLEEAGLLYRLDLHIIDCVIQDMLTKRMRGTRLVPVSVNISLRDLKQIDLVNELIRRTDEAIIPRSLIRIEFTESEASSDPEFFREQVRGLRKDGFEVWMDDFGSGNSSLGNLQEFEFDLIKLDMGFLRSTHKEKANIIIASIIHMASKLGMGVLAEGVETLDQALFLEQAGCEIIQGYYYAKPTPLSSVIENKSLVRQAQRELLQEQDYWNSVGLISLNDLSLTGIGDIDGELITEFPAGVLELRKGSWRLLRANSSMRHVLDRADVLPLERSNLQANLIERPLVEGFYAAVDRCRVSKTWERLSGRTKTGSRFQFYVTPLAHAEEAEAFMAVGVPTMLGAALGAYGDVPVGYAVFRAIFDEARSEVLDVEFVFANDAYCEHLGFTGSQDLINHTFLELVPDATPDWLPYCYKAIVGHERAHGVLYSPETSHWISFYVSPSPIEDHCIFAFAIVDDERRARDAIIVGRDTSDLIINIANALNGESSYDAAMQGLLETMSKSIHPERLYILERRGQTISNTFEWCAPGIESQIHTLQELEEVEFRTWEQLIKDDKVVFIPDVSQLQGIDPRLYWQLERQGITHLLASPIYYNSHLIGYLAADNYELERDLDTQRLLSTVSSFIGARIANQRLMEELERIGMRDSLTGLLNRRGMDLAISQHLKETPNEPYVLVLMDVDNFKGINDLHGHDVGDTALRFLSKVVTRSFSKNALVGRNGGDEFLVVLFGPDAEEADERISALSAHPLAFVHEGTIYRVSLSIGYVSFPSQASSLKDAYTKADTALYAVKLAGKSSYRRYEASMDTQLRSQLGFTPHDIAANLPGAILIHVPGGEGRILYANDELLDLFECETLDDFMAHTGGTYAGVIHPDDHEHVRQALSQQMGYDDVGEKDYVDFRIITKSGKVRHVSDSGRLVEVDGMGKVFYELIVSREAEGIV